MAECDVFDDYDDYPEIEETNCKGELWTFKQLLPLKILRLVWKNQM